MSAAVMDSFGREESRTVVVSGVPDALPDSRMIDKLTIHFQSRRRSDGGDVEVVLYPSNMDGVAFVTFDNPQDAERVVRKEQHIMADNEFPEVYLLTVFSFTRDVFFYVQSATVDLSAFGSDQASLIRSLRSAHRSLRFRPLLQQSKAVIEGPFAAVRSLKEDLIRRSSRLKSTVSAQIAADKLRETRLNPRVISHHESVGSIKYSVSKAKLEPVSSNSLSTLPQTTGDASQVQSRLSNVKTQNASSRRNDSSGVAAKRSFCNTDSDEEEQRARLRLQILTEYRTERAKADPTQMFGKEINARIRYLLPSLTAEEISAKQSREDDISLKHTRPDRVSATKIRGENHLGSRYSSTDCLRIRESDQSSSAITAKLLQTRLKDVSQSPERDAKDTEELSAICPEHPEDMCIWVDSNAFTYIEKLQKTELDRCLRGLDASIECVKGSNLMRIALTEKQTSKTASSIQQALKSLSTLVEFWLSKLRVRHIYYEQPDKQKLIQICKCVNFQFDDILCVFEDSYITVIGPSLSSYLFHKKVRDRIDKLKDTSLRK